MFKFIFLILFSFNTLLYAGEPKNQTSTFPLLMLNLTKQDVFISFKTDIGLVYLDEPLEDNTLLSAGSYSYIYGVNFAPRDLRSKFKMIFDGEKQCIFTVGYFRFPDEPKVSVDGDCEGAGYRVEMTSGYQTLVLYVA